MSHAKFPSHLRTHSCFKTHASALLLLGALCLPGCKKAEAEGKGSETPVAAEAPVHVETSAVAQVTIPRRLRLTGNLRGAQETDLAANVAGMLTATQIERGQSVEKGQVLARVDVRSASLALAEAKVAVANTQAQQAINFSDCQRYEQLKQRGAVTDLEYDQVTAKCKIAPLTVEAAQARQSIAAKNVGDGVIRSPFSGVIIDRYVEVGEYVQPSSRVASLAAVNELHLEFSVPEQHFPDIKAGAEVQFQVAAYGDQAFVGKVTHISGAVRPTRDVLVEAVADNAEGKLLPGMFADIQVTIGTEELPSVPQSAVFEKNGKQNVFVVTGGILEQRVIQPGLSANGQLAVLRGVVTGDQVVIANLDQLKNGQHVE